MGAAATRAGAVLPLVELPNGVVAALNVLAAGAVHAGCGYLAHRLPAERLRADGRVSRLRRWEHGGTWYRRRLRIDRWKDRLPEAGALFPGGVSKRRLPSRDAAGLERFLVETRRAERSHWWAMSIGPIASAWNPPAGAIAMLVYGVVVNLPFVAVQRFNRARAARALDRASRARA